jgi:hypothetical protein
MNENGKQYDQDDTFEGRLYQALALIERAGEQQRTAAATVERLVGLEQSLTQVIQAASSDAAARIAGEARSALTGAFTESAATLSQAARSAVAAAENLRWPWWLYLLIIPLSALLSGVSAIWMTDRPATPPERVSREDQRLIDEGRMLERVWPRLSRSEQKKIEHLAAQTVN